MPLYSLGRARSFVQATLGSGDGQTTAQSVGGGSFTTVNLNTEASDLDGLFNTTTHFYTVPATGIYTCTALIRAVDGETGPANGLNVGMGVHSSGVDGPWFAWNVVNQGSTSTADRFSMPYVRTAKFTAGDQLRLYVYSDGASLLINTANLTVEFKGTE